MNLILIAVISLGAIALVLAAILYVASKKFAVYEDPRIAQVGEVLPQANCGGCGYPGCSGFADACVKAGSLDGKFCPVGGHQSLYQSHCKGLLQLPLLLPWSLPDRRKLLLQLPLKYFCREAV